jgi:hypothetical protein
VTHSATAGERKKLDEGTMMAPLELIYESDPMAVADPRETQSLMPATTKDASDIQMNRRNRFSGSGEN